MVPFFVQIKCHLGKSYQVANAIADVAARLGALMRARPEISEIDINPLVAYPRGVLALDVLIVTSN